jgi:hypothetical protein
LQTNSGLVLGSDEDPKDGGAVAGAVFGAVAIYAVRITLTGDLWGAILMDV